MAYWLCRNILIACFFADEFFMLPVTLKMNSTVTEFIIKKIYLHYLVAQHFMNNRPFAVNPKCAYKTILELSWNWNSWTETNTLEDAEFGSEKFPHRGLAIFSPGAILPLLISWRIVFIVHRHGLVKTQACTDQNDQFLLTWPCI